MKHQKVQSNLGYSEINVIELGVAGGDGIKSLIKGLFFLKKFLKLK